LFEYQVEELHHLIIISFYSAGFFLQEEKLLWRGTFICIVQWRVHFLQTRTFLPNMLLHIAKTVDTNKTLHVSHRLPVTHDNFWEALSINE